MKPNPESGSDAKISCRGVWKLFGPDPQGFLRVENFAPSEQSIRQSGHIAAIRDANLDVAEGEIFVIMGLSGSGKSTLVRCLSGLIEATAGEVFFNGADIQKLSEKQLNEIRRHKMGMVFQNFALLPHLTVLGNIAFPLEIQGVEKATRHRRALEVIELVGLSGRENYYPRELSGGQQQRVGIARSLAVEPEIWFLDEPFSALDPLIRGEMQDEFLRLQNMLHKTIVFITHDFDEAIRLADRIAIMKDGTIVQTGSPEDLVLRPATDYVGEFTRNVSRAKVLSARSVMDALDAHAPPPRLTVTDRDRIDRVAATILDNESDATVVDAEGSPIGVLTRRSVIDILVNRA